MAKKAKVDENIIVETIIAKISKKKAFKSKSANGFKSVRVSKQLLKHTKSKGGVKNRRQAFNNAVKGIRLDTEIKKLSDRLLNNSKQNNSTDNDKDYKV